MTKINYASMVDTDTKYPVAYTIKQDGTKIFEHTFLLGKDLTENQIKELCHFGWFKDLKPNNMNDIERNNKTVLELIDILIRSSLDIQRVKELVNLKKELIESPQPEGYQGLNKWYLTDNGSRIRIVYETNDGILIGYGLNGLNCWDEDYHAYKSSITRELTEQEATQTILKGCEQNGIVEGAVVTLGAGIFKIELGNIEYVESTNALWMSYNNEGGLDCGKVRVFGNGKFAEVVKEEKPTDKELLKECSHLITTVKENMHTTEYIRNLSSHLLTKLNKHLNHE